MAEGWPPLRRERTLDAAAVAIPALLATALCLYELGTRSLWLDESATFSIASQHGAAFGSALARDGGNMLGYYSLLHVLIGAFGHGTVVLRLPSAIATGVSTGLVGLLSLRLWDRRCAWLAGVLFAASLTLVYWGQQARGYAVMMALIVASFLAFVWLIEARSSTWRPWALYVVLTTAAVYAGLEAALVIPAQLLLLARHRDRARAATSAVVLSACCCVPLAILAAQRGSSQLFWVPAPSWRTLKQVLQALTSSGLAPAYYTASGDALLILTCVILLAGAWTLVRGSPDRGSRGWGAALVASWIVVPVVLMLLVSTLGHSIFQARYALVALPAVAIFSAWTLTRLAVPRAAAGGVLLAVVVLRVLALAPGYGVSTEQWREAASYVAATTRPGDCIAFYPLDARMPFEYYEGGVRPMPGPVLPVIAWGAVRPYLEEYRTLTAQQVRGLARSCSRVWLVWSHEGHLGGPPESAANFRRLVTLRAALAGSYPQQLTRTFGRASPISVELVRGAA